MLGRYRHILWDWNGTLLDDTWLCHELTNQALRSQNLSPLELDYYRDSVCSPLPAFYERHGFDFSQRSFEDLSREWHTRYEARFHECELHRNVTDLLQVAVRTGVEQSILSLLYRKLLVTGVNNLAINDYFTEIVGQADMLARDKIHTAKAWFAANSLKPEEIVVIGDTSHDFEVAQSIGVDCILVANGLQSKRVLTQHGCTVLDSLEQLEF